MKIQSPMSKLVGKCLAMKSGKNACYTKLAEDQILILAAR